MWRSIHICEMIFDIMQTIINYMLLRDQIICSEINNHLNADIKIYHLDCPRNMDNKEIKKKKFNKIKILNCNKNMNIEDVNIFENTLEILICCGNNGITQEGISRLKKIRKLKCDSNKKIKNVNHFNNTLIELKCFGNSGIDQKGISKLLCLEELSCKRNEKINNVNHLKNTLRILDCSGIYCGINQDGIAELKCIEHIYHDHNNKIYNLDHLKTNDNI